MTERSMSTDPVFAAIEARNVTAAAAQAAKGDRELNSTSDAEHRSRAQAGDHRPDHHLRRACPGAIRPGVHPPVTMTPSRRLHSKRPALVRTSKRPANDCGKH
jgi:hypothetical protein